jgi:transposase-like protein
LQEKAALVRFILGTIRNYTTHPQRLKQVQNKWLMVVLGSKVQR